MTFPEHGISIISPPLFASARYSKLIFPISEPKTRSSYTYRRAPRRVPKIVGSVLVATISVLTVGGVFDFNPNDGTYPKRAQPRHIPKPSTSLYIQCRELITTRRRSSKIPFVFKYRVIFEYADLTKWSRTIKFRRTNTNVHNRIRNGRSSRSIIAKRNVFKRWAQF